MAAGGRITRKQFLATVAAGAVGFAQPSGRRPNVLILMSDQHRPHAIGPMAIRSPNAESRCALPLRHPLRQRLLLEPGLRAIPRVAAHRTLHAQSRRLQQQHPLAVRYKTIAHHFDRAGYMTGLIGKMHFVDAQTPRFRVSPRLQRLVAVPGSEDKTVRRRTGPCQFRVGDPADRRPVAGSRRSLERTPAKKTIGPAAFTVGRASKIPEKRPFREFRGPGIRRVS